MSYDPKCYEIAEAFLEDEPQLESKVSELAQAVQDAIEDWIAAHQLTQSRQEQGE